MRAGKGFTVIELMAVVAVTAVLLALTVPSFLDLQARHRVEGVTQELMGDLKYARTESLSRQQDVALETRADGAGYTITVTTISPAIVLKTVSLPTGTTVTPNIALTYTQLRGIPNETATTDKFIEVDSSRTPAKLRVRNNFMGRVEVCSLGGNLSGYEPCSS